MSRDIWVEWIGLWGSGKSTCIDSVSGKLEGLGFSICTTKVFFSKNKISRRFESLIAMRKNLIPFFKILYLLMPIFFKSYLKKDTIVSDELRSFLSCFLARISMVNNFKINAFLWEGEFHLLPLFEMSDNAIEKIADILLNINTNRDNLFIVMNTDINLLKSRIKEDHDNGKNIRFKNGQISGLNNKIKKFDFAQKYLLKKLKNSGSIIFECDGNTKDVNNYILKFINQKIKDEI